MSKLRSVFSSLELIHPRNNVTSTIARVLDEFPEIEDRIFDAYSLGQVKSKLWLIDHLPQDLGLVFICAGWYGTLANLMFSKCPEKFTKIRSFDIDPECAKIAEIINKPYVIDEWKFKASTLNILDMKYPLRYQTLKSNNEPSELKELPKTIINTSCEHIVNFNTWYENIPSGRIVVLQTNNYFDINDHVNCVESLEEFESKTPMSKVIYSGELDLINYTRYMRIGIK
jgi:hypothetical protein